MIWAPLRSSSTRATLQTDCGLRSIYALLVLGESERVFGHKTRIDLVARALSLGP
jgi:hypothetical protein